MRNYLLLLFLAPPLAAVLSLPHSGGTPCIVYNGVIFVEKRFESPLSFLLLLHLVHLRQSGFGNLIRSFSCPCACMSFTFTFDLRDKGPWTYAHPPPYAPAAPENRTLADNEARRRPMMVCVASCPLSNKLGAHTSSSGPFHFRHPSWSRDFFMPDSRSSSSRSTCVSPITYTHNPLHTLALSTAEHGPHPFSPLCFSSSSCARFQVAHPNHSKIRSFEEILFRLEETTLAYLRTVTAAKDTTIQTEACTRIWTTAVSKRTSEGAPHTHFPTHPPLML
ncbi:unnamed protein product [Ectocarpus sp. 12 AP-2014]